MTNRYRTLPWRAIIGLALMIVLYRLVTMGPPVQAHALLARSIPVANSELTTSPDTIEMWFSETLEPRFSSARVVDKTGAEVVAGPGMVDAADAAHMTLALTPLDPGVYTVVWRTFSSVDGHEWVGSFPITILFSDGTRPEAGATNADSEQGSELPTPAESIARWISLMGAIVLVGALFFRGVLSGAFAVREQSDVWDSPQPLLVEQGNRAIGVGLVAGTLALIGGGWAQLIVQGIALGDLGRLPELVAATRPGNLILLREFLAGLSLFLTVWVSAAPFKPAWRRRLLAVTGGYTALLLICIGLALLLAPITLAALSLGVVALLATRLAISRPGNADSWPPLFYWNLLLAGFAILLTFSFGSHAAAAPGSRWAILADVLHFTAAAAWLGGLLMLATLLWLIRVQLSLDHADADTLRIITRRFSTLAATCVFLLVITGLFSSLVQLPRPALLWTTTYGWVLIGKLIVVALALGVALFNTRLVHGKPALGETAANSRRFLRQLLAESFLGLGIMIVVAVLVQTPAPQATVAAPVAESIFYQLLEADDLQIHMQIAPYQVGHNRFELHLYHADNSPIGDVQLVRLFFVYQNAELGQAQVDMEPVGPDIFAIEGAYLSQAGLWDMRVYVRRRAMDDALVNTVITVPDPMGGSTENGPWQNPIPAIPIYLLVAGVILSLATVCLIWLRYRRWHVIST